MTVKILFYNVVILFVFTLMYEAIYRWDKRYFLKRIYLIFITVFSIITPLLSFDIFPYRRIISTKEKTPAIALPNIEISNYDWLLYVYITGVVLSLMFFLYRLVKVVVLINKTKFRRYKQFYIADRQQNTFSFLNYIFLFNPRDNIILNHEIAHVLKYHSVDVIFFEIAKIVLWFNPFIYRIKFLAQENHEFEADDLSMRNSDIDNVKMAEYLFEFAKNIIVKPTLITNNFYSLTKNRIDMLAKNQKIKALSYLLLIPVVLGIFSAFTFKSYPVYESIDGKILQDTLVPGYFTQTDTIVNYDPETKKETSYIVNTKISMDEYLESLNFSGKMSTRIDTVPYYDPETKKETIVVYHIKYPFELRYILDKLSWEQQDAIIKHYGSQIKVDVEE